MAARRSKTRRQSTSEPFPPDESQFWLVLDTIADGQRDATLAVRKLRARMCHDVGELLAHHLAHSRWTQETLERLSAFLVGKGVAPDVATVASLVRMARMVELERGLVNDRGLAPIFTPLPGAQPHPASTTPVDALGVPYHPEDDDDFEAMLAREAWPPANT